MKRIVLFVIFSFIGFSVFAVYPVIQKDARDTVFLKNGLIVGKVKDIKRNRIVIESHNGNTQIVALRAVQKISFARNIVPSVLLNEQITYNGQKLKGRVLYMDVVHSDVLFYDANSLTLRRLPLLETSLASRPVKSFYKTSLYVSIIFMVASVIDAILSVFHVINVYIIAAVVLFLFSLVMFLIFGLPWIRHKKRGKHE